MAKKLRGLGIASKVEDLGVRDEVWTDGEVHQVHAYRGVDRKVWVRFFPRPAIGIGKKVIGLHRKGK